MHDFLQVLKKNVLFTRNPCVYALLYAIYIYDVYLYVTVSRVWYVYACIHALGMIYVYTCFVMLCFALCYVCCSCWCMLMVFLYLYVSVVIFSCWGRPRQVFIVQVRSDAGWVIVRCRILNLTNELSDPNCLWVLVGWPWPGGETT